jgi:dipeptidyl aminopeptidase/acylaminoacyl peptidase
VKRLVRPLLVGIMVVGCLPSFGRAATPCGLARSWVVTERTVRGNTDLWGMTSQGDRLRLTNSSAADTDPSWSPNGSALVFVRGSGRNSELWTLTAETCREERLTRDRYRVSDPDWGPGGLIAFTLAADHDAGIVVMTLHDRMLYSDWDEGRQRRPSWSPLGDASFVYESNQDGNWNIYRSDGNALRERVTDDPGDELHPAWSPDGGTITFSTDRDGNQELYTVRPDGTALTRMTDTTENEIEPAWGLYASEIVATRSTAGSPVVVSVDRTGGIPAPFGFKGTSVDIRGPSEFTRFQDSLAKGSIRRAVAVARGYYRDNGSYDGITVMVMEQLEPDLTYVGPWVDSSSPNEVSIREDDSSFVAVACSDSGACFAMQEVDNAVTTHSASLAIATWSADHATAEGIEQPAWPYE